MWICNHCNVTVACLPRGAVTNADGVTNGLHATGPVELQKLAASEPLKLPEQQLAQQLLAKVYDKACTTVECLAGQSNSRCGFQAQSPSQFSVFILGRTEDNPLPRRGKAGSVGVQLGKVCSHTLFWAGWRWRSGRRPSRPLLGVIRRPKQFDRLACI